MSAIRCVYHNTEPNFPATDQHPDAVRYGPIKRIDGSIVFVDAIGGQPSLDDINAVLNASAPAAPDTTAAAQKLAAAGLSVAELKELLGLPI